MIVDPEQCELPWIGARVRIDHVTRRYGRLVAVDDLSLRVPRGEFFVVLGQDEAAVDRELEALEQQASAWPRICAR
mgnify:CR=1 FL=1